VVVGGEGAGRSLQLLPPLKQLARIVAHALARRVDLHELRLLTAAQLAR
jgi:hypothetical protein